MSRDETVAKTRNQLVRRQTTIDVLASKAEFEQAMEELAELGRRYNNEWFGAQTILELTMKKLRSSHDRMARTTTIAVSGAHRDAEEAIDLAGERTQVAVDAEDERDLWRKRHGEIEVKNSAMCRSIRTMEDELRDILRQRDEREKHNQELCRKLGKDISRLQKREEESKEALRSLQHMNSELLRRERRSIVDRRDPNQTLNCVVCYEKTADTALVPCGHMVYCGACAPARRLTYKCPLCRDDAHGTVRVWPGGVLPEESLEEAEARRERKRARPTADEIVHIGSDDEVGPQPDENGKRSRIKKLFHRLIDLAGCDDD